MVIRYEFASGCVVESNPNYTTGEMFAKQVIKHLVEFDQITNIQFILEEI